MERLRILFAIVPSSLFSVLSSICIIRFMYRYFIYLSFDGRAYHGWQIQPNGITVEEALEEARFVLERVRWRRRSRPCCTPPST